MLCSSDYISSFANSLLCWACLHWSLLSVSHRLETTPTLVLISSDHLPDTVVQGLFLRSYLPHDHSNQLPPFIDRRYIFIEQVGCIPSISPSLFPLIAVLIWPLLFSVASLAYLGAIFFRDLHARNPSNDRPGLAIHSVWASRRRRGVTPTSSETVTLGHFLRLSISLFFGIFCTGSVSLFLLLGTVSSPGISVNSVHHDFQTVSIIPTAQWSLIPQLRNAVKLRWLWASLSFTLSAGLFPKERIDWVVGLLTSARMYFRMRLATHFFNGNSTLTITTEHGIDQPRMRSAMDLSLCIFLELRVNLLLSHPSSDSRHSLPPLALDLLCNLTNMRYCPTPPNSTFDLNPLKLATQCDLVSPQNPKKHLSLMNSIS